MPVGWRIVKSRHAATAFDGEGARLHGGRWSSPGMRMVYTADSPSLAALEVLVGLGDASFLPGYVLCSVEIPDAAVESLDAKALPANWQSYPAPPGLQRVGDAWLKDKRSLALRVPSVVVPRQPNFLLNPDHRAFAKLRFGKAEPFVFDERLIKRRHHQ